MKLDRRPFNNNDEKIIELQNKLEEAKLQLDKLQLEYNTLEANKQHFDNQNKYYQPIRENAKREVHLLDLNNHIFF